MRFQRAQGYGRRDAVETTLPLINVAFLLLVFFLMAGTVVPPKPIDIRDLRLIGSQSVRLDPRTLYIAVDGTLYFDGTIFPLAELSSVRFADLDVPLRVHADAESDANQLIAVLRYLASIGLERVQLTGISLGASACATADCLQGGG